MDAYCEHLGAHLGYGGHVEGEVLQCPFHGWQWNHEGRNVCIPYQDRPNRGRRIRTYPTVERNESVYIWHDVDRRDPFFEAPDIFASFDDTSSVDHYYPQQRLYREALELHPQYVLENGVDFAHFKFVHQTPIVPVFTRHDFDDTVSYVDFTITFEGDDNQVIDDVKSGVEAINGGLGIAVTKSWGMVDNRTISAITPVDHSTSDVRFMVYIGRKPGDSSPRAESKAHEFGAGGHPAVHPGCAHLAASALFGSTGAGELRDGRVHRNSQVGHPVLSRRTRRERRRVASQSRERSNPMSATHKPIRVFQVATGNVGSEMIKRIATQPDLELIGVHCYSPDKIGKDAGELAGLAPNGVKATGSIDEIIAAKPDVLTFHGVFPDEDLYVKVLEAGIDIVTTADWITGWHRDTNHPHPSGKPVSQLLQEACTNGGATFYGTGMNPGLNQILGVVCSADVADIENVTTIESVDVSCHHSKDTWIEVGYGQPVDDPSIPGKLEKYTRVFADSVLMMADCFDLQLDEVKFSYELGACTKDVDLGWYKLPKGSLGGNYLKYQGMVDGVPRVETHLEWQMTPHTDPSWDIKGCYITHVKGDPCIYNKHMVFPKPGVDLSNPDNFASIGMTITGMPALAAIRSVVAAPPGLVTSADLPLRGFAGRFRL